MFNREAFRALNFFGWWPLRVESKGERIFFRALGYFLFLSNIIQLLCEYTSLYYHLEDGNFKKILLNMSTTLEGNWCSLMLFNLLIQDETILSLLERAEKLEDIGGKEVGEKRTQELTKNGRRFNRLIWISTVLSIAATVHWVCTPLILTFLGDEYILSYDTAIPWDYHTVPMYILTMIVQTVHVSTALSGLFLCSYTLLSILGTLEIDYILLGEMFSKLDYENEKKQLNKLVDYHVELQKLAEETNRIYGKNQQFECFHVITVCCVCVVNINNLMAAGDVTFSKVFNFSELACFTLFNLFIECYLCQQVIAAADNLTRAVHNSNWYFASTKTHKSLSIVLEFSKRPIMFGGPFAEINLETYINVIKSIFSFYNFIVAMDSIM